MGLRNYERTEAWQSESKVESRKSRICNLRFALLNLIGMVGRAVPCAPQLPTDAYGFSPTARTE